MFRAVHRHAREHPVNLKTHEDTKSVTMGTAGHVKKSACAICCYHSTSNGAPERT